MQNFKSKRKQDKPEPTEVRNYKLRVMLNQRELEFLDTVRGRHSRAETMRFLLQDSPPKSVPEVNQALWMELSNAGNSITQAGNNINQIARKLNCGELVEIDEIREQLSMFLEQLSIFRAALLGAENTRGEA